MRWREAVRNPVRVGFQAEGAAVNPLIFGHFIEFIENCIQGGVYDPGSPASDANGIRQDVLEKAKLLRPTILRWPGGTYANIYHWTDCVGPKAERKKKRNLIWGGVNDGAFGTAEFIEYCRALGAEPMLCVNLASGTAEEAANWVEYCNGEAGSYYADLRIAHGWAEPFAVKYWCIGNESHAEPDLGAQHDPDRYISDTWEFVKHMKLTDPTIRLVLVGDMFKDSWNKRILESLHPVCDYFSIHHYSNEGGRGTHGCFVSLRDFDRRLDALIPLVKGFSMRKEPFNKWYRFPRRGGDIKLCLDEWNIWSSTPQGSDNRFGVKMVYNWRDALWTACMMNLCLRRAEDIAITNLAQMVNVLAPILTEGDRSYVQTIFHVLKLYRDHAEGTALACRVDAPLFDADAAGQLAAVDGAACRLADGTIRLFLTNITRDEPFPIALPEGHAILDSLTLRAPALEDCNTLDRDVVEAVRGPAGDSFLLPAGSVAMLHIREACGGLDG